MKKVYLLLLILNILSSTTVYEDGEDGKANDWRVQGNGEVAKNIYSPSLDSRVIRLEGRGGPWILGAVSGHLAWNNRKEKYISWKMVMGSRYTVYIPVTTKKGTRYLFYNDLPKRILRHGFQGGILHGLGGFKHDEYKNVWRTYTRNLETDLKDSEPDNELISVNGFIYSGADASLDDILLYNPKETIYEDGTTPNRWIVSDNTPNGATISSIDDPQGEHIQGKVIKLNGSKLHNAYRLNFSNSKDSIIQWKSRFYENYSVSLIIQTKKGTRELLYTNSDHYTPSGGVRNNGYTIWHEMGGRPLVGKNGWEQRLRYGDINHFWQTVTRDLSQDLKDFERDNEFISISSFEVRGSGLIDDIKMLSRPTISDPKEDTVYENGENGISKWHIYDNSPEGATISNITDNQKGRVIEFNGNGFDNGYEIGARRGNGKWNDTEHKSISFTINFSEYYTIYIAVDTTNGVRYLTYEPRDNDRGVINSYIRFGVGANTTDGTWRTINRNLQDDLHKFEPDSDILAINALLVRGSGKIDDIKTMFIYNNNNNDNNNNSKTVYEDAEDSKIDRWSIFSNASNSATITNIFDEDRGSRVISLHGVGKGDGYMIGSTPWHNHINKSLKWSMKYQESFTIYISVQTKNGRRYLTYTPIDNNRGLKGSYIRIGLGSDIIDNSWHTFTRDLNADIKTAEPNNELIAIDSFRIRGTGLIDDIEAF